MEGHMISLIQSIRHKDVTIFDDIDAASFSSGVLKTYLTQGQHHKDIIRYANKAWVSHYAIITKASKIRNWVEK